MAQVKVFSLGGLGAPCCCKGSTGGLACPYTGNSGCTIPEVNLTAAITAALGPWAPSKNVPLIYTPTGSPYGVPAWVSACTAFGAPGSGLSLFLQLVLICVSGGAGAGPQLAVYGCNSSACTTCSSLCAFNVGTGGGPSGTTTSITCGASFLWDLNVTGGTLCFTSTSFSTISIYTAGATAPPRPMIIRQAEDWSPAAAGVIIKR